MHSTLTWVGPGGLGCAELELGVDQLENDWIAVAGFAILA